MFFTTNIVYIDMSTWFALRNDSGLKIISSRTEAIGLFEIKILILKKIEIQSERIKLKSLC